MSQLPLIDYLKVEANWDEGPDIAEQVATAQRDADQAALKAQVAEWRDAASELSVCLCGCPMDVHENYGEDGISCENAEHTCLHVYPAVLSEVTELRQQVAALTTERDASLVENERLREQIAGISKRLSEEVPEKKLRMSNAEQERDTARRALEAIRTECHVAIDDYPDLLWAFNNARARMLKAATIAREALSGAAKEGRAVCDCACHTEPDVPVGRCGCNCWNEEAS